MRSNIKDIMHVLDCSELIAEHIENDINEHSLLDWSECTNHELHEAVVIVYAEFKMTEWLVVTSRRHELNVRVYGPFDDLDNTQEFMRTLAKRIDNPLPGELENNYHIDTDNFFLDITTLSDPNSI